MKTAKSLAVVVSVFMLFGAFAARSQPLTLHTRARVEPKKGSGEWQITNAVANWEAKKTALVICDMWDQHWCKGATERVAEMAPRMNKVTQEARKRGVLIIHCPSGTMKYYEGIPQ